MVGKTQTTPRGPDATVTVDAPSLKLEGGTILTAVANAAPIQNGSIALSGGAIFSIGDTKNNETFTTINTTGKFITPGIIDTHSHIGVYPIPHADAHSDGNEVTKAATPHAKAEYGYWSNDPAIRFALAGGVTTALILPGSANLIGGEGYTVQMKFGRHPREVAYPGAPRTLKMACGENPKRVWGDKGGPQTRMAEYAAFRKLYKDAKGKKGDATLKSVLAGDVLVQIHCYRSDDIMQMVHVAEEAGFKIRSFHHALEAYKVRDALVKKDIAINTWADWWGFKMEAFDGIPQNAGLFTESGGRTVIHSDSAEGIQRLNQEAAKAMWWARHSGIKVSDNQALRWITANAAWVLGIESTTGTLETGKRADVVVWSAHPLSAEAKVELVIQGGKIVFDASKPQPKSDFELGHD